MNERGRELTLILSQVAAGIAIAIITVIVLPVPSWFIVSLGGEILRSAGIQIDLIGSPSSVSLGVIITIIVYSLANFFLSLVFAIANQRYLAVTILFGSSVGVFFVYNMLRNLILFGT